MADRPTAAEPEWLVRSGLFRRVVGYDEAVKLLSDGRLHADLVGLVTAIGAEGDVRDAVAASLLSKNGDDHRRTRAVVGNLFTPRQVERVRPFARSEAQRLAGQLADDGCELVGEFASPFVAAATGRFVGFTPPEIAACRHDVDAIAAATDDLPTHIDDFGAALLDIVARSRQVLADRSHDDDTVLGTIARAVRAGDLDELDAAVLVATMFSAGHEPTTKQIGITVLLLAADDALWDAVAAGDVAVTRVVEESLRCRSTNQGVNRRVAEPFEFGGAAFADGEQLIVSIDGANHDARRFGRPDRFAPAENEASHLAFGFGAHHCLGAALARLQLAEAIDALTARFERPEVVEVVESTGGGLIGPTSLRLRTTPRRR